MFFRYIQINSVAAGALVSVLLASAHSAHAQTVNEEDARWYVTLNGGWSGIRDANTEFQPRSGPKSTGELQLKGGYLVGAAVGYRIAPSWRAELEVALRSNDVDKATVAGLDRSPNNADLASLSFMFNGYYDFSGWQTAIGTMRPFVGAGLGWAQEIDADLKAGSLKQQFEGDRLAYQLLAGINNDFGNGWFAGVRLKWFDAGTAKLESTSNFGTLNVDYSGLSAEVSLGYRF
jgi:outer membrane protein W